MIPQNEQDRDWLDEKLAVTNYIPDAGFSARVVARLPESRPAAVGTLRWRILSAFAFLAGAMALVLTISEWGALIRGFNAVTARTFSVEAINHIDAVLQQPGVIYGGAGAILLLGFAAIPFLRRWA